MSAISSYFTVLQKTQILDAFPLQTPQLRQVGSRLLPSGPTKLMLVNGGNLPIAVTGAEVTFSQCSDASDERCDDDEITRIGLASLYQKSETVGTCQVFWQWGKPVDE